MVSGAIPGGTLDLPADSHPTWTARLAWESGSFSYSGRIEHIALQGGTDAHPIEITHGSADFSNQDATDEYESQQAVNQAAGSEM